MFAVQSGVPEVVKYLLSKGADSDVNLVDNVSSNLSSRSSLKHDHVISTGDSYKFEHHYGNLLEALS